MGFWDILKHKYMTHMTEYKIKQLREDIPNAYDLKQIIPYDFKRISDDGNLCVLKKKGRRVEFYIVVFGFYFCGRNGIYSERVNEIKQKVENKVEKLKMR